MNSIKNSLIAGMVALSAFSAAPSFADHHHHDNDHYKNWDHRDINQRVNDNRYDYRYNNHYDNHNDRHYRHQQAMWNNDWNGQRTLYRNNWNRISRERQRELDAQMRAQWLAYHHNNWNGSYNWNTYNDPLFLDYLHTSNPGLLTTLRNYLGF